MAEVKVGENESIESALRRFKKKIQKAGKCLKKCRISAEFPKRIAEIDRKNQNFSLQHQTTGV